MQGEDFYKTLHTVLGFFHLYNGVQISAFSYPLLTLVDLNIYATYVNHPRSSREQALQQVSHTDTFLSWERERYRKKQEKVNPSTNAILFETTMASFLAGQATVMQT